MVAEANPVTTAATTVHISPRTSGHTTDSVTASSTLPSDAEREVLRLRVVAGLSAEQVATLLGCSPETVRLRQHRALEVLRNELIARDDSSEDDGHGNGARKR